MPSALPTIPEEGKDSPSPSPKPKAETKSKSRSEPHLQEQCRNPSDSRQAKPQGPREAARVSQYQTLPDLRFLNHSKPALTLPSILDEASVNGNGMQQYQALKAAETWYSRTKVVLQERLELCEKMHDGLKQVNSLIAAFQTVVTHAGENTETNLHVPQGARTLREADQIKDDVEGKLSCMEKAAEAWLRDIRVSRAKWIAGGTDMERRFGFH